MKIALAEVVDAFRAQKQEAIKKEKDAYKRQVENLLERQRNNVKAAEAIRTQFQEVWDCYPDFSQVGVVKAEEEMEAACFEIRFDYHHSSNVIWHVVKTACVIARNGAPVRIRLVHEERHQRTQHILEDELSAGRSYTDDISGMVLKHAAWVGKIIALKNEAANEATKEDRNQP